MNQRNFLLVLILLASCSKATNESAINGTDIVLVHDLTDALQCTPEPEAILGLHAFDVDKNQAASFRYVLITDKQSNSVETIQIADGKTTEKLNENDEEDYREKMVWAYYDAVRNAIKNFPSQFQSKLSLEHSECFATIASQLEELAQRNGARQILISYGDLSENSEAFSCYSRKGKRLLKEHPEKVAVLIMKSHTLPKTLRGTSIYFVFNPRNREEDIRFNQMVTVYRYILQGKGARIIVQSQNNYYQP
jgi:hypothetical protein